jgi:CheY-like chemotaxis protein
VQNIKEDIVTAHQATARDKASILIVDDSPENLRLLVTLLGQAGYTVRPHLSGGFALESAQFVFPDLILLDIDMPVMDGYEVCRRLKTDRRICHVPVIFISARDERETRIQALEAGAVDYVAKPFNIEELLQKVNEHVPCSVEDKSPGSFHETL